MKKINIIFSAILLIILNACTEKIDIKLDDTYTRLVVDGCITTDTAFQQVRLSTTTNYYYNQQPPAVTGATVVLSDGTNEYVMKETVPGSSGIYQTQNKIAGETGKTYTLKVNLPEAINKHTDYSASSVLHPVAKLDSTGLEFHEDWGKAGFWVVKCYATDPGGIKNYYLFNVYRNGKLLSDTINKVVISDDILFDGNFTYGIGTFYLDNNRPEQQLRPGDTVTLEMSGITQEYYNFVSEVQQAGFNIPFFSGPPANVSTNISPDAVGFFTAYSSSRASVIVKP